jgi:hypothetical protein
MPRGLKFEEDEGFYWATELLKDEEDLRLLNDEDLALVQVASRLESSKDYRTLSFCLDKSGKPKAIMLNATLGRILDAETINRYFRRFRPEFGNNLHSELARSLEYLNLYSYFGFDSPL